MFICDVRLHRKSAAFHAATTAAQRLSGHEMRSSGKVVRTVLGESFRLHRETKHNASGEQERCGRQEVFIRMVSSEFSLSMCVCVCVYEQQSDQCACM